MDLGASYKLFGSEETVTALGAVGTRLPEIAHKDVLVITRDDLFPGYQDADSIPNEVAENNLRKLFKQAGISATPEEISKHTVNIFSQYAYARGLDRDGDGENDIGIIVSPDMDMSPQEFVSILTDIPQEFIKDNLPGIGSDYLAGILFHEARHLNQDTALYGELPLPYEIDADRIAIQELFKANKEGIVTDSAVGGVMLDARIIGGLGQDMYDIVNNPFDVGAMFGSHSTHLSIDQTEATALPSDPSADPNAIIITNTLVNTAIGRFLHFEGARELKENTKPAEERIFADTNSFIDGITHSKTYAAFVEEHMKSDPAMTHAGLSALREKGYIKDGTPEASYADKAIGFYEKYIDLTEAETPLAHSAREFFDKIPHADSLPRTPEPIMESGPEVQQGYKLQMIP